MVRFWARASPPAMNSPDRAARVLVKTFFSWKLIRLIGWLIKDYVINALFPLKNLTKIRIFVKE
jgi:hypothetical protein